jgi:hypothetical protein
VNILDNKKLKKYIFKKLSDKLSGKTYYPYGKEIWIIDLDIRDWYFKFTSESKLYYNPKFFDDFFGIFGFNQQEYQNFIKSWFESSTDHRINEISRKNLDISYYIDGITRGTDKNWKINERYGFSYGVVKQFLDLKRHFSEENIKLEHFLHEIEVY